MSVMIERVPPPDSAEPDATPRILVVEDDFLVAAMIADVLQIAGYRVAGPVASGNEALSVAATGTVDLAVVDIRLAGPPDGITLAGALRDLHGLGAIFLSGAIDAVAAERAARVVPYGLVHKPFIPSELFRAIEHALLRREAGGAPHSAPGPFPAA